MFCRLRPRLRDPPPPVRETLVRTAHRALIRVTTFAVGFSASPKISAARPLRVAIAPRLRLANSAAAPWPLRGVVAMFDSAGPAPRRPPPSLRKTRSRSLRVAASSRLRVLRLYRRPAAAGRAPRVPAAGAARRPATARAPRTRRQNVSERRRIPVGLRSPDADRLCRFPVG